MIEVTRDEVTRDLERLLKRVAAGEEVIIAEGGKKVARLVPYAAPKTRRVLGRLAGQIQIAPDFDDPLPPELLAEFER